MKDKIIKRIQNLTVEQQREVMAFLDSIPKDGLRGYSRLSARLAVDAVVDEKSRVMSDTRDISASGIYIKTDMKFKTGKSVHIAFSIPDHDIPLKLHGEITRIEKDGMAIRFNQVNPNFKKALDDALMKARGG
ncbi:MAG: PilZ domain-containing protein [Desulfobacterales bacterium]|nr:PilZ domain-containing protein [Desulfobacterales bacterium]